jgi:hypothetical protein
MSTNPLYAPLQHALEQKAQEEITKLLGPMGKESSKNLRIKVSIENETCHNTKSPSISFLSLPRLDANQPHTRFQNSLTEDMARMLQHAY